MCVLDLLSVEVCVPGLLPHVIVVGSSNNVLEYPVLGGRGLVAVLPVDWFRLVNQLGLHISMSNPDKYCFQRFFRAV